MEQRGMRDESRNIERTVVMLFAVYTVIISGIAIVLDLDMYNVALSILGWGISAFFVAKQLFDYRARAFVIGAMFLLGIFLYSIQMNSLYIVLPMMMTMMVIVQMFGIPEIIFELFVGSVIIFSYHLAVLHSVSLENTKEYIEFLFVVFDVVVMHLVVFLLLKKRQISTGQISKIISQLIGAEKSKDEFLANVSHELRTPLNTICGLSELSMKEDNLDVVKENLSNIQVAGRNLISVVSDILDYSSLLKNQVVIEEENYQISSTINDLVNTIMAKKADKNIEIIVDCNPTLPSVLSGDEKKIRHAIMNIVDNAIKFTNDGSIGIEITYRRESYGINLIITIRDTGIGMQQQEIEKIFKEFSQADTGTSRQQGGLGLGLAIANAMIRKMGGVITVRSKFGKGTSMRVTIPQKVVDETPIVSVNEPEAVNAALYLNLEKYRLMETRDEYSKLIDHILTGLQVKYHICRSVQEVKRREANEKFTHLFITSGEYQENPAFFEEMSNRVRIILLLDQNEMGMATGPNFYKIMKPYYVVPIVTALNNIRVDGGKMTHVEKFVAPDAHVLIVDDNDMNLLVIERLLKTYKIKVTKASSGLEALDKIESKDYDFVFMDHMMPEMDGIETAKKIREKKENYFQKVPIIALTANAVVGAREMFLEEGFADFLEKPVEISVLERVLRRNLPETKIIKVEPVASAVNEESTANEAVVSEVSAAPVQESVVTPKQPVPEVSGPVLNRENGIAFCGGIENYYEIVRNCHAEFSKNCDLIQGAYEKEDWKNYIIYVHALKSTMKTIGADDVSAMAKELEFAGKENNIALIYEKHDQTMDEYARMMAYIASLPEFGIEAENASVEDLSDLVEMSDEEAIAFLKQYEDAVFNFDEDALKKMMDELNGYQYHGKAFAGKLDKIQTKVMKSDYMSSLEDLTDLMKEMQKEG